MKTYECDNCGTLYGNPKVLHLEDDNDGKGPFYVCDDCERADAEAKEQERFGSAEDWRMHLEAVAVARGVEKL